MKKKKAKTRKCDIFQAKSFADSITLINFAAQYHRQARPIDSQEAG